jgi:hypothetical protein
MIYPIRAGDFEADSKETARIINAIKEERGKDGSNQYSLAIGQLLDKWLQYFINPWDPKLLPDTEGNRSTRAAV